MSLVPRSKSFAPSPMEKSRTIGLNSLESLKPFYLIKDQKSKLGIDHYFTGAERVVSLSMAHWKTTEQDLGPHSNLHVRPISLYVDGNKNSFQYKNALFSTSLSEVFDKELRLSSRDALCVPSIDTVNEEDEPFESLEETEFQTVGNFLPDEDELLSGIIDDMEYNLRPNSGGDAEDDLFCSGGGMELEADDSLISNKGLDPANGVSISHHEMLNSVFSGEQPFVEHPSRTLLVWNINSEVEDYELRALFERYGDVHTLYTAFKHRGFVMISYYDIRSACNAMKALQNKPLRHTRLEIHFSVPKDNSSEKDINQGTLMVFNLDSSVSNEDLCQIFGIYGEIKEICRTPHKHHHKFIEFYDVRAAEAAFCALNGSYIAGKRIKLELSRLGVATWRMMQHLSSDLEQEEANGCCEQGSPSSNSPLGDCGSINLGVATSYSHDSGSLQGAHSTVHAPCCPIVNSRFCGISSNIPQTLSSPISATSVGNYSNQSEHIELSHSVGEMKSRFDYMSTPYSRSLCECHDCVANGIHLNSPSTTSSMAININSSPAQGVDNRHIYGAGSCRLDSLSNDYNGGLETSWNGSCPLHGQQCVWGNSNSPYQHPQGQIIWPDSPLLNNISASSAQLHGLPRTQSHMLNIVPPLHHHHVGSTPSVNPSLWERRHAYAVDATNASESHPDSLGSMRFFGCSTLHLSELASPNIFPHFGGNVIDPSISSPIGLPSRQRCHLFHGRTSMIPLPAAFDPNDHARGRRNDAISNQVDNKRQYELDIERIIRGEDSRTTLMIKNIPNKYTSKMLLAAIDERHRGTYDFIYLPIDFKNKCNVGYAFINMIDPQQIIPFYKTFNGKKWEKFNSEKVVLLAYARIQGKAALIAHFQNSSLMNEDKRCRPILFHTDGPNAGDQEPFPMGVNGRSRPGRPRITSNEDDNQQSLSPSTNGEEPSNGDSSPASVKDV